MRKLKDHEVAKLVYKKGYGYKTLTEESRGRRSDGLVFVFKDAAYFVNCSDKKNLFKLEVMLENARSQFANEIYQEWLDF